MLSLSNRRRTWLAVLGVSLLVVLSQSPQMSKADVLVDEDGTLTSYCDYKDYEFDLMNCEVDPNNPPKLTIELSWDSNADIDLLLFAPDGTYMVGEDIFQGYNGRSCLSGIVPEEDGKLCDGKGKCNSSRGIKDVEYTGYTSKPEKITITLDEDWDEVGSPTLKGQWIVRVVRFSPRRGDTDFHVKVTLSGCVGGAEGFSVTPNAIVANVYPSGECSGCQCPMSATTYTLRINASKIAGSRVHSMKMKLMDEDLSKDLSWWVSNVPYNDVINIGTISEGEDIIDFNVQICNPGKKFEITQLAVKTPKITSMASASIINIDTLTKIGLITVDDFTNEALPTATDQSSGTILLSPRRIFDPDTTTPRGPIVYEGTIEIKGSLHRVVIIDTAPVRSTPDGITSYDMVIVDMNDDGIFDASNSNTTPDLVLTTWNPGIPQDGFTFWQLYGGEYYQLIDIGDVMDDTELDETKLPRVGDKTNLGIAYSKSSVLSRERLGCAPIFQPRYTLDAIPTRTGYAYGEDPNTNTEWLLADLDPDPSYDTVYIHRSTSNLFCQDFVNYITPLGYGPSFRMVLRDMDNDGSLDLWASLAQIIGVIPGSQLYEIGSTDNDGDNQIDEDPLDWIDNDGDGLIDEDAPGDYVRYAISTHSFILLENIAGVVPYAPMAQPQIMYAMYNDVEYLLVDWDGDGFDTKEDRVFWHDRADDDFRDDQYMYILAVDPDGEWFYGLQKCCMFDCANGSISPGKGCFPEFCGVDGDPFFPTIENITGIDIDTTERYGFGLIDFNRDWEYDYEFLITDSEETGRQTPLGYTQWTTTTSRMTQYTTSETPLRQWAWNGR